MAAITSTTESWNNHSFSEVETHIKGNYTKNGQALPLSGGTMTGSVNFGNKDISGAAWVDKILLLTQLQTEATIQRGIECRPGNDSLTHYIRLHAKEDINGQWYQDSVQMKFKDLMHNVIAKRFGSGASTLEFGVPGTVDSVVTSVQGGNVRLWCYSGSTGNCCMTSNSAGKASFGAFGSRVFTYQFNVIGDMGATAYNNTSDMRKKDYISDAFLDLDTIANAPVFNFKWKDQNYDTDTHVGTSAQYWKEYYPNIVSTADDKDGTLSMQYGVLSLSSAVSIAKEAVELKKKIAFLENKLSELEAKLDNEQKEKEE